MIRKVSTSVIIVGLLSSVVVMSGDDFTAQVRKYGKPAALIAGPVVLGGIWYYHFIYKPQVEKQRMQREAELHTERIQAENRKCADMLKDTASSFGIELSGRLDRQIMQDNAAALFGNRDCKHNSYNKRITDCIAQLTRLDRSLLLDGNVKLVDTTTANLTKLLKAHNGWFEAELAAEREAQRKINHEELRLQADLEKKKKVGELVDRVSVLAREVGVVTRDHKENRAWHERQYRGLEEQIKVVGRDLGSDYNDLHGDLDQLKQGLARVTSMVDRLMPKDPLELPVHSLPIAPGGPSMVPMPSAPAMPALQT